MQSKIENNRINKAIETSLKNVSNLVDVNMIVGEPIKTDDGAIFIPISKVTVGILAGGGEYGTINIFKKGSDLPYSAGNGTIVSVKPCGFLYKDGKDYKILNIAENAYEKLLDKASDFICELKDDEQ